MFSNYFRLQGIADMAELAAGSTRSRMTRCRLMRVEHLERSSPLSHLEMLWLIRRADC